MVDVKKGDKIYSYPDKCQELVLINKNIKEDFTKICKQLKINKSYFIQNVYSQIISLYNNGDLKYEKAYMGIKLNGMKGRQKYQETQNSQEQEK